MSFDLQRILESKRAFRQRLAARPIAEKLRILDSMRERALALGGATPGATATVREDPGRPDDDRINPNR